MDTTERFYKIDHMLRNRGVVSARDFLAVLEVSPATFKRDLQYLRDRLYAPIIWDREKRGYRFADPNPTTPQLPGLWFNGTEIHALLTMHHLLENLQPGLLGPHIEPLKQRIKALIEKDDRSFAEVARRIRVLPIAARRIEFPCFQSIAHALLTRHRLRLTHYSRARDEETEREVSPQRLVHYRDNWYLDTWDHNKEALRSFAVDSIRKAVPTDKKARTISDKTLDADLAAGYGIFAGKPRHKTVLRFTLARARWVADEEWHPEQKGGYKDGYYLLEIPYADDRELIMDILKYGPDVEVLRPAALRDKVRRQLEIARVQYNVNPHPKLPKSSHEPLST